MQPKKDNKIHILFRYGLISALILLFTTAIVVKLFSTTVVHADDWNRKAMKEMERVDTTSSPTTAPYWPRTCDTTPCASTSARSASWSTATAWPSTR